MERGGGGGGSARGGTHCVSGIHLAIVKAAGAEQGFGIFGFASNRLTEKRNALEKLQAMRARPDVRTRNLPSHNPTRVPLVTSEGEER